MRRFLYLSGLILFICVNRMELRYLCPLKIIALLIEKFRIIALRLMGSIIGGHSWVRAGLFITSPKLLKIGKRSKIGPRSQLFLYDCFEIGDDVEIGSDLIVHTSDHKYGQKKIPLAKQGGVLGKVIICDDVYIGSRVTILCGVKINSRTIIAAGAVITESLDGGYIYGGIPARAIKKLDCSDSILT